MKINDLPSTHPHLSSGWYPLPPWGCRVALHSSALPLSLCRGRPNPPYLLSQRAPQRETMRANDVADHRSPYEPHRGPARTTPLLLNNRVAWSSCWASCTLFVARLFEKKLCWSTTSPRYHSAAHTKQTDRLTAAGQRTFQTRGGIRRRLYFGRSIVVSGAAGGRGTYCDPLHGIVKWK